MLRSLSFAAAMAAILVIPFTEADARHGGHGGHGGRGMGGMSAGHSIGARSFSGPRSIGISGSVGINRSIGINRLHVGPRRVAFVGPRFRHRRFVGLYSVGLYSSCWRWVPSVYGVRRVWVCDPYYGYY
jgi:hypothetical protein